MTKEAIYLIGAASVLLVVLALWDKAARPSVAEMVRSGASLLTDEKNGGGVF